MSDLDLALFELQSYTWAKVRVELIVEAIGSKVRNYCDNMM